MNGYNLGTVYHTSQPLEAERAYRDAQSRFRTLVEKHPTVTDYQAGLADCCYNLGRLHQDGGRPKEAEEAYQEAVALRKALAEKHPAVMEYAVHLDSTQWSLGDLARRGERFEAALGWYDQAVATLGPVLAKQAGHAFAQQLFRSAHVGRADALTRLGNHTEAAEAAEKLPGFFPDDGRASRLAAGFLARCIPIARADAQLPEANRQELARAYADQAVALLRKAAEKGHTSANGLKGDPVFKPLHSHDGFQKLLIELEEKAKPRAKRGTHSRPAAPPG